MKRSRRVLNGSDIVADHRPALTIGAAYDLWMRRDQQFSAVGLAVTGAPIMYVLAKRKIRIANRLGSRALRADAMESLTCGYLSALVVVLLAQVLVGAWWVSAASALMLVPFLLREAREDWQADHCCHD